MDDWALLIIWWSANQKIILTLIKLHKNELNSKKQIFQSPLTSPTNSQRYLEYVKHVRAIKKEVPCQWKIISPAEIRSRIKAQRFQCNKGADDSVRGDQKD